MPSSMKTLRYMIQTKCYSFMEFFKKSASGQKVYVWTQVLIKWRNIMTWEKKRWDNDVEMFSLVNNMVDPLTKLLANLIFNHHQKIVGFF